MRFIRHLTILVALFAAAPFAIAETLNINSASASMLADGITGIGDKKAQAIVQYRNVHGPFATVDDLVSVKGIGPKTVEKNRDKLTAAKSKR